MKKDTVKRKTALILALLIVGSAVLSFAGCTVPGSPGPSGEEIPEELRVSANESMTRDAIRADGGEPLRALVLYADAYPGAGTANASDETSDGAGTAAADLKKVFTGSEGWAEAYTQLTQSLLVNLEAEAKGVFELARSAARPVFSDTAQGLWEALEQPLAAYDLIELDPSVTADPVLWRSVEPALRDWVRDGGFLFVANPSVPAFDKDFIGISDYKKLNSAPTEWTLPEVRGNLAELQEVLSDYLTLFRSFRNARNYAGCDFGYVFTPRTAVSLVDIDASAQRLIAPSGLTETVYAIVSEPGEADFGKAEGDDTDRGATRWIQTGTFALSTVNRWGDGFVLACSGLLPNGFTVNSYTLQSETADRETFIPTTAACSELFRTAFASFASKETRGYAVKRIFGSDGTPSIAWQLHYEEETGIANGSALLFADLAERYGQIPSYTLVRNVYTWFRSSATVSYILGSLDDDGHVIFEPDPYENAYDSGTHFVDEGTGAFLTFDTVNTGSYFTPNPWDDSAGCTVDVAVERTADGTPLFLFRTPDGKIYTSYGRGFRDGNYVVSSPVYLDPNRFDSATGYDAMTEPFRRMDAQEQEIRHFLGTPYEHPGVGEWSRTAAADLDGDGIIETVIGNADGYLGVYTAYLDTPVSSIMKWRFDGRLGSSYGNAFGNSDLKFGEYACPSFADLNGDGIPDLIVGHREYGLAYPVDSPYFPERDALSSQLAELTSRGYYIGAHVKTTIAATPDQERTELELHRQALAAYGIDVSSIGVNHHTWVSANASLPQSFESEWAADFLWDSGWKAANNTVSPENNAENALVLPFFRIDGNGDETILLFNTSTVGYDENGWSAYMAKYGLPVSVYYHCDLAYLDPDATETFVRNVGAFADRNGYRWVSEDTLAKEIAAAYNVTVGSAALNGSELTLRLDEKRNDFPLYDPAIQSRANVRIEPAECFDTLTITAWQN